MPDCWSVNVNPISGELIVRWRQPLQTKGSFPLAIDLTYRAMRPRSTVWGRGSPVP